MHVLFPENFSHTKAGDTFSHTKSLRFIPNNGSKMSVVIMASPNLTCALIFATLLIGVISKSCERVRKNTYLCDNVCDVVGKHSTVVAYIITNQVVDFACLQKAPYLKVYIISKN